MTSILGGYVNDIWLKASRRLTSCLISGAGYSFCDRNHRPLQRLSDVKLIPDHYEDAPGGDVTAGSYAVDQLPSLNVTRNGRCAGKKPARPREQPVESAGIPDGGGFFCSLRVD